MKQNRFITRTKGSMRLGAVLCILAFAFAGCDNGSGGDPIAVAFNSVTPNGGATQTTTVLTLAFSKAIADFTEDDITLSGIVGVIKGALSGNGPSYTLPISGFSAGGTVTVEVSKEGYAITPASLTATVYVAFIDMVWIEKGTFLMGSPETEPERWDDETQHTVTLTKGFFLGKHLVTQPQWIAMMGATEDKTTETLGKGDKYPVYNLNWYAAIVFCNKLSMTVGLTPAYSINGNTNPDAWGSIPTTKNTAWDAVQFVAGSTGYRLPTEAQWEYACRAGTTTPFSTGDNITTDQANFDGKSPYSGGYDENGVYLGKTTEVGSYDPNDWGLYDMHGNLWEWCWDWNEYEDYGSEAQTDPEGIISEENRILRGGDYGMGAENSRSARRYRSSPYSGGDNVGLRVMLPLGSD